TQLINTAGNRVTVISGLGCGLDQLCHHMWRCGQIGIAHAEVNDVFAPMPRFHLHAIDDAEDIGRQPLYPLKFHARYLSFLELGKCFSIYKASLESVQTDNTC